MGFSIETIATDDALKIISSKGNELQGTKEAISEELYWQTIALKELRESSEAPEDEILAKADDIRKMQQSLFKTEEKIKSIDTISAQQETSFFSISKDTRIDEIKELLHYIEDQLKESTQLSQILFFETLKESAETCKEYCTFGRPFETLYIPMLESEKKYSNMLITELKLDAYIKEYPANIKDLEIIKGIYHQAALARTGSEFVIKESAFLARLQSTIEQLVNKPSSEPRTGAFLVKQITDKIAEQIKEFKSNPSSSYVHKKLINKFCVKLNIPAPFVVTQVKKNIINQFNQLKTDLGHMKATMASPDAPLVKDSVSEDSRTRPKGP